MHSTRINRTRRTFRTLRYINLRQMLARTLSVALIMTLLTVQTPAAAPQMLIADAASMQANLSFWFVASGWRESLVRFVTNQDLRPKAQKPEKQKDRDARVARVAISPGGDNLSVPVGGRIQFAALAFDTQGAPVGGVNTKWRVQGLEPNKRSHVSPRGEFEARQVGTYSITAEAAGQSASVQVRVTPGAPPVKPGVTPVITKSVSSRRPTPRTPVGASSAEAAAESVAGNSDDAAITGGTTNNMIQPESPWNDGNSPSFDDPGNQIGDPPGTPADDGAGNGNFQIAAPVAGLEGRGIDIALALAYNSRVWNKAGSEISFDIDKGYPAPGWSLGFGKLSFMGIEGGSMLSEADGTRRAYTDTKDSNGNGGLRIYPTGCSRNDYNSCQSVQVYFTGHTTDGTFIDYRSYFQLSYGTLTYGDGSASLPNGTTITYRMFGQGAVYPTSIQDANGNIITVTYRGNKGPNIETITDTLGRAIQFHYDESDPSSNRLTAVTAPGLASGRRTLVRLVYQPLTLNYAFDGLTPRGPASGSQITVLKAIYYPGTATGYWFGDADSYSSYGMLKKVVEQRAMTFAGDVNNTGATGDVYAGAMTQQLEYDYPAGPDYSLRDAPQYRRQTHTWDKMTGEAAATSETNYQITENAGDAPSGIPSRKTVVIQPNGTQSIQWSYNYAHLAETDPNKFKDGLIYMDETRDAAGGLLSKSEVEWQQGDYESPRPIVTRATNGEINQTTRTQLTYGAKYNQVTQARDYGYAGELLRVTKTEYENASQYIYRHIFNLVKATEVWNAAEDVRQSRVEYQYDGGELMDAPGAISHSWTHNPKAPRYEVDCECSIECVYPPDGGGACHFENICRSRCTISEYDSGTHFRGLVTEVKTYANAANLTDPIVETRAYDITGNLRTASTACCEQMSINYSDATQYAYPDSQTRGSRSDANQQVATSAVYDFNTGLVTQATDADGLSSTTQYSAATLRPTSTTSPTGATTFFEYNDTESKITETLRLGGAGSTVAATGTKYLNGLGQVRREEALGDGVTDTVETEYDNLGRAFRQSRPVRGTDARRWTTSYFDALNRTSKVVAADGSTSYAFYNGKDADPNDGISPTRPDAATTAAGETTLSVDAWGRARWGRTDAQGRLVEVVEPDAAGNGSIAQGGQRTEYDYDTLGRLTQVRQGTNLNPAGVQVRRFAYDSLGRLTRQKLAETEATINDGGSFVGAGGAGAVWSDAFVYDNRSNMTQRTDARGVKTAFAYNDDPLNRLQGVSYTAPQGANIPAAASVAYTYLTKAEARAVTGATAQEVGDITRLKTVAAGASSESYAYDSQARIGSHMQTILGRPALQTDYLYDALDRVTDIRYPAQYGVAGSPRKIVHHDYDAASRLSQLKVGTQVGGADGALYASGIRYNAASQTTQMTVGSGANQVAESYAYDPDTGLLTNQKVTRGATRLLDLSYDYLREGTSAGRTGHLTKITNNLDAGKNKHYRYDALGRLTDVGGGGVNLQTASWKQRYAYDRYGNRTSVQMNGEIAVLSKPIEPQAASPSERLAFKQRVELPDELKAQAGDGVRPDAKAQPVSDSPFSIFDNRNKEASRSGERREQVAVEPAADDLVASSNNGASAISTRGGSEHDTAEEMSETVNAAADESRGESVAVEAARGKRGKSGKSEERDKSSKRESGEQTDAQPKSEQPTNEQVKAVGDEAARRSEVATKNKAVATTINAATMPLTLQSSTVNLAQGKSASQSSIAFGGEAGRAVDGNTDGRYFAGSVTHTDGGMEQWWQVDLGGVYNLERIDLWNRTDCCAEQLANYYVLVSNEPFTSDSLATAASQAGVSAYYRQEIAGTPTPLNLNRTGRYVRVQLAGSGIVSLAEVQVWGQARPETANLAQGKSATQSSTAFGGTAERAVDGNTDGNWGAGSVTHTDGGAEQWWEVDLGGVYNLERIDLWNRTDCCAERLANYYVLVSNESFVSKSLAAAASQTGVTAYYRQEIAGTPTQVATGRTGRYVRVQLAGSGSVSLAEVQVWGRARAGVPNVARGKAATQSSTQDAGVTTADKAVDGNTDGFHGAGTISHTRYENEAWWQVDLGARYNLTEVKVWNRADGLTHQTSDFYVRVSDDGGQWTSYFVAGEAGRPTTVAVSGTHRYVRVQLSDADYLTMSEVEVFGTPAAATVGVPRDGHQSLAYDQSSNRITSQGFEYDAAGNQTRAKRMDGGYQRFVYDAANRLVEVRNDAGSSVYESYRYGVGNSRVTSEAGGLRTYYAGGGGQASVEYVEAISGGNLAWSKTFIYAGGSVLATITPNGASEYVEYHHPDRLGTRLITNNANQNVQEQETLPYGAALSSGSSTRQFTSYDRSASTGLDYAVNRRYDSLQGRFTQVDPLEMDAASLTDPQSLNLYSYCGNDPINHTDPDGLFWGKLWRGIKKVLTSKWFVIAVTIAIAVLTIGASLFPSTLGLSAANAGLLPTGYYTTSVAWFGTHVTAAGWAVAGLSTALAIPGLTSIKGILRNALDYGIGRGIGSITSALGGDVSSGGTPDWNPTTNSFVCCGGLVDGAVNASAGFADWMTLGYGPAIRTRIVRYFAGEHGAELQERDNERMSQTNAYTGGQVAAAGVDLALGGKGVIRVAQGAGYGGKFALHTAHHSFGRLGKRSHLQLNVWKRGVKGSSRAYRTPLPMRKYPKRERIFFKF